MITAEEFVLELNNNEEQQSFKLAIVVALFENDTAKIKFDGEEGPSEKQYAYLNSYTPKISDRVLLGAMGGTYIILGKVNYGEKPSDGLEGLEGEIISINAKIGTMTSNITIMQGDIGAVSTRVGAVENRVSTIEDESQHNITSNQSADVGGNRNIDYMYVDPSTGRLWIRRKNGAWTTYEKI